MRKFNGLFALVFASIALSVGCNIPDWVASLTLDGTVYKNGQPVNNGTAKLHFTWMNGSAVYEGDLTGQIKAGGKVIVQGGVGSPMRKDFHLKHVSVEVTDSSGNVKGYDGISITSEEDDGEKLKGKNASGEEVAISANFDVGDQALVIPVEFHLVDTPQTPASGNAIHVDLSAKNPTVVLPSAMTDRRSNPSSEAQSGPSGSGSPASSSAR